MEQLSKGQICTIALISVLGGKKQQPKKKTLTGEEWNPYHKHLEFKMMLFKFLDPECGIQNYDIVEE